MYQGRVAWNKQRKHEVLRDENDVAAGYRTIQRWNPQEDWIISDQPTHPRIIDDDTFARAQQARTAGRSNTQRNRSTRDPYLFSGLLRCGFCQRRMQGQVSNHTHYYR